ncbi:MAG: ribonuclease P protein component [Bacteroidales bacterium]|nr:ribonuclease P protein component [Bacteroidales bacterium]
MAVFPKSARKLSLGAQANLHQSGQVVFCHPYKVYYLIRPTPEDASSPFRVIISVPKRNVKRAVDRNRIKRQIRESIRLNASVLNKELTKHNMQIDFLCLYLPHEHTSTSILFDKMGSLLERLGRLVALAGAAPTNRID